MRSAIITGRASDIGLACAGRGTAWAGEKNEVLRMQDLSQSFRAALPKMNRHQTPKGRAQVPGSRSRGSL
jgi:hypothetical protein